MKLNCFIRVETETAYKVETLDYDFPFWVPKSVVEEVHKHPTNGYNISLTITDWWWDKFEDEHS